MKRLGFSVLMVEKNDHRIGGDCFNDGCVPSKAFIHVSRQVNHARSVGRFGVWAEDDLKKHKGTYERVEYSFSRDGRAVIEDYEYARIILFVSSAGTNPFSPKILGGTIIAPNAGELVQELVLAQQKGMTASNFFNKVTPIRQPAASTNQSGWIRSWYIRHPSRTQWLY